MIVSCNPTDAKLFFILKEKWKYDRTKEQEAFLERRHLHASDVLMLTLRQHLQHLCRFCNIGYQVWRLWVFLKWEWWDKSTLIFLSKILFFLFTRLCQTVIRNRQLFCSRIFLWTFSLIHMNQYSALSILNIEQILPLVTKAENKLLPIQETDSNQQPGVVLNFQSNRQTDR